MRPRRDIIEATNPLFTQRTNHNATTTFTPYRTASKGGAANEETKEISVQISVYCCPRKV